MVDRDADVFHQTKIIIQVKFLSLSVKWKQGVSS